MTLHGIDVSNWQGGLSLANVPCDFVIAKATEGLGFVDRYCDGFIQQAKNLGRLWGFYHFAQRSDAVAEADFFVDNCLSYFGEGIPVLDYEADAVANGPAWVERWMNRVHERTGVWPMFYSYQNHLATTDYSNIRDKCALWVARYADYSITDYGYPDGIGFSLGSWPCATVWQYSSTGRLPGWDGNLDLNHAYIDADAWMRIARGDKAPEPQRVHNLQLWDYHGGDNQLFWVRQMSNGHIALRSVATWEWLSDPNSSTEACPAELWGGQENTVGGGDDPRAPQELILEPSAYGYKIHPSVAPELSLDAEGGISANGTKVQWWPNNESLAQLWSLLPQDGGKIALISACGALAVDVPNGGWI